MTTDEMRDIAVGIRDKMVGGPGAPIDDLRATLWLIAAEVIDVLREREAQNLAYRAPTSGCQPDATR